MNDKIINTDRTMPTVTKENRRWLSAMFDAVGATFSNHAVSIPGWYVMHTWTKALEQEFLVVLVNDMVADGADVKDAQKAAMWFVANYGWKVKG